MDLTLLIKEQKGRRSSMKIKAILLIGVLTLVLSMVSGCGSISNEYGTDYKTKYADELELAFGPHTISESIKETLHFEDQPEIKRLIWRIKYTDADGKERTFKLANNGGFKEQIYNESIGIFRDKIYELLNGDVSSAMAFIGSEKIMSLPLTEANKALFPHYITSSDLPDYILIDLILYDINNKDKVIEILKTMPELSFYLGLDGNTGIIVEKGIVLDKTYNYQDIFDYPNLP